MPPEKKPRAKVAPALAFYLDHAGQKRSHKNGDIRAAFGSLSRPSHSSCPASPRPVSLSPSRASPKATPPSVQRKSPSISIDLSDTASDASPSDADALWDPRPPSRKRPIDLKSGFDTYSPTRQPDRTSRAPAQAVFDLDVEQEPTSSKHRRSVSLSLEDMSDPPQETKLRSARSGRPTAKTDADATPSFKRLRGESKSVPPAETVRSPYATPPWDHPDYHEFVRMWTAYYRYPYEKSLASISAPPSDPDLVPAGPESHGLSHDLEPEPEPEPKPKPEPPKRKTYLANRDVVGVRGLFPKQTQPTRLYPGKHRQEAGHLDEAERSKPAAIRSPSASTSRIRRSATSSGGRSPYFIGSTVRTKLSRPSPADTWSYELSGDDSG
ncbi:uncharacterized protein BJ171DRAFT_213059 [Polychytrium aggregatum]|uniref:uncharacterized protein n=1 Tax=Polychytrium aggregatum TaxID=110093 RepID=UPI0022FEE9CD|nr:uncharacterized protein BJ171DRAFT_213059 [Polychytrium aggregatum]KAI9208763.1 hypothetical protein BJ171DRAFT_213059 [Polychytrium aggregatum]